jgi:outer membrane protein assembly factor BamB
MKLVRYLLLVATLVIGGCASDDETVPEWAGGDGKRAAEPAKLVDIVESAKFAIRWQYNLGGFGANLLLPAITKDAVYGASGGGGLTRLDRVTGKVDWHIETGVQITGGVGSGEGLLLIGSDKGEVLAYDEDGLPRWRSRVSSEVLSAPQVSDGIVIVRSGDGRITGLNVEDGNQAWLYERSTPALVVRSHAGLAIQRGVSYAGFAGGKLVAINAVDGSLFWEATVSQPRGNTELDRISDITNNPVVDGEQVCAIAFQGSVACVDIVQGTPLWSREISSDKGLMLLRSGLYFSDDKGLIYALDKVTGSTIWKNEKFSLRESATPYAMEKHVVFGDFEGYLHALNREDGKLASRIRLDETAIQAQPITMDDGLLVQTSGGGLYSLSLH